MADCYTCRNTHLLEAAILQGWIDMLTIGDPGFPQTPEDIIALADPKFFNISQGDFYAAYRGWIVLANVAQTPSWQCDLTGWSGGEQKARAAVVQQIVDVILIMDAGYDTSFANLTRNGCITCAPEWVLEGCILYCVQEYVRVFIDPPPSLAEAIAAGCCCGSSFRSWSGVNVVQRAPDSFSPPEIPYTPPPVLSPDPGVLNPGVFEEWEQYSNDDPIDGKRLGWSLIDATMQWLSAWGARTIRPDVLGYDDFESYTADVDLNGLTGGEAWGGALIARRVVVPRANGWTDFSDATLASDINGQTSGDWAGAFIAR